MERPGELRFAWGSRLDGYLLFGETAWGDQYAYRVTDGRVEPEVYLLEMVTLGAEQLSASFDDFMTSEFLPNARAPYDGPTVDAVGRLGPVAVADHWVYSPSLALGGLEDPANVLVLPASTAMRMAGDLYTGLRDDVDPSGVISWVDDRGRQRMRVEFDSAAR